MPSTSLKQHNLMAMVANNPSKAKELGIPKSVGQDFMEADKGKKFGSGGPQSRADSQVVNKPETHHGKSALFKKGGVMKESMGPRNMAKDVEKGSNKLTRFGESAVQKSGKTRGTNLGDSGPTVPTMDGMKRGGMAMFEKSGKDVEKKGMKEGSKADMALDKKQMMGMKKGGMMKYAKGGMIETSMKKVVSGGIKKYGEHTVQEKGHTKARQVSMSGNTGMKRGGKVIC